MFFLLEAAEHLVTIVHLGTAMLTVGLVVNSEVVIAALLANVALNMGMFFLTKKNQKKKLNTMRMMLINMAGTVEQQLTTAQLPITASLDVGLPPLNPLSTEATCLLDTLHLGLHSVLPPVLSLLPLLIPPSTRT